MTGREWALLLHLAGVVLLFSGLAVAAVAHVVSELRRRGWTPILSGRDKAKLNTVCAEHPGSEVRGASVDAATSLDRAFSGAAAVINCAGPFIDTAAPVMEAAVRARIHYLDVTAEQPAALAAFERFADAARNAGIVIAPAMAFYGGLGDLLATVAIGDWPADEVRVAVALDSWKPTRGTQLTGQRNPGRRLVFSQGRLQHLADPPPTRMWRFPGAVRGTGSRRSPPHRKQSPSPVICQRLRSTRTSISHHSPTSAIPTRRRPPRPTRAGARISSFSWT